MAPRSVLESLEKEFERRWQRRRRRRRGALLVLIVILILCLWPWTCEGPGPGKPASPLAAPRSPQGLPRGPRYTREAFQGGKQQTVPWGRELSERLAGLGEHVQDCLPDKDAVAWDFLFNPHSGQIRPVRLSDGTGEALDEQAARCIAAKLPKRVVLKSQYAEGWWPVRTRLLSPGQSEGEPFEIATPDAP